MHNPPPPSRSTFPSVVVMWFRRDLRIDANAALQASIDSARRRGARVLPLFVLDPKRVACSGANRLAFLYGALQSLRDNGVPLVIREGSAAAVLSTLVEQLDVAEVICAHDFSPSGTRRDANVAAVLESAGVPMTLVGSPYLVRPGSVRKGDNTPFKVFTPFRRVWEDRAGRLLSRHETGHQEPIDTRWWFDAETRGDVPATPDGAAHSLPVATEAAAHDRLHHFLEHHLYTYDRLRNDPAADATSRLSADLKFGLIHPVQIVPFLSGGGTGPETFRAELCWREFYADVLWHRPETATSAFHPGMERMEVDTGAAADARFTAWCEGRTGYPFIDAGMRQLLEQGWMHNRVRMAAASFLVKDLHIDWRRGAAWFMEKLVDGDIASNQHGWQWTAGTGTDAAPYYRIFNPTTQGRKFDPSGTYIRRFVPELAHLGDREIHEPWSNTPTGNLFTTPGSTYPPPIVDHATERAEALKRYAAARPPLTSGPDERS